MSVAENCGLLKPPVHGYFKGGLAPLLTVIFVFLLKAYCPNDTFGVMNKAISMIMTVISPWNNKERYYYLITNLFERVKSPFEILKKYIPAFTEGSGMI